MMLLGLFLRRLVRVSMIATATLSGCLVPVASSSSVLYDPSLGTLPTAQGWTFEGVASPPPSVVGGVLYQGPTGDSQYWTNSLLGLDFSSSTLSFSVELDVLVTSSGFVYSGGTTPRAGYEITAGDSVGRVFSLLLSDNRIDLLNAGTGDAAVFANFTTTDEFHNYQLTVESGVGQLFVDHQGTPLLSLSAGSSGWLDPGTILFGDGTSVASSETQLARIEFTTVPEPSTGLLLATGLLGLAVSGRRRRASRCGDGKAS